MLGLLLGTLATILHAALMFAVAPLIAGLATKARAGLLGFRGAPLTQPYRALARRVARVPVVPDNASALYQVWPFASLGATAAAALLTPGFCFGMVTARQSDFITFIGLLGIAQVANVLAGLETGFSFGGAAAGRAVLFGLFAMPALLLAVLTLALLGHSATIDGIGNQLSSGHVGVSVSLGFALLAVLAVALTESGRPPADDPAGQAELAMVQNTLLLEYSGRFLALFVYAAMLRLTVWMSLIASIFIPFGMADAGAVLTWPLGLVLWLFKLVLLAAALALFEVTVTRIPVSRIPAFFAGATLLGLLAVIFLLVGRGLGA